MTSLFGLLVERLTRLHFPPIVWYCSCFAPFSWDFHSFALAAGLSMDFYCCNCCYCCSRSDWFWTFDRCVACQFVNTHPIDGFDRQTMRTFVEWLTSVHCVDGHVVLRLALRWVQPMNWHLSRANIVNSMIPAKQWYGSWNAANGLVSNAHHCKKKINNFSFEIFLVNSGDTSTFFVSIATDKHYYRVVFTLSEVNDADE